MEIFRQTVQFEQLPLYRVAQLPLDDPRKVLQIPDAITANRMYDLYFRAKPREERIPSSMKISDFWNTLTSKKEFKPASWKYLKQFFGNAAMYTLPEHRFSIHGDAHQDRVTLFGYVLGQMMNFDESQMKVLLVAASIHDRARINDGQPDEDHGKRVADNIEKYLSMYRVQNLTFTDEEVEGIRIVCQYHEIKREDIPEEVKQGRFGKLLVVMQAADAADRYRIADEKWHPDPKYFDELFGENSNARDIFLKFAGYFTLSSEKERFEKYPLDANKHIEGVIQRKAREVGIVYSASEEVMQRVGRFTYRRIYSLPGA